MDHSFTEFNALLIGNKLSVYLLKHDFEVSYWEIMRAQVIICDIGFSGVYVYVQCVMFALFCKPLFIMFL